MMGLDLGLSDNCGVKVIVHLGAGQQHSQRLSQDGTLEDRKDGFVWIFPDHSCENIQKCFEFLDTFGYSPIIAEQLSDVLGQRSPP